MSQFVHFIRFIILVGFSSSLMLAQPVIVADQRNVDDVFAEMAEQTEYRYFRNNRLRGEAYEVSGKWGALESEQDWLVAIEELAQQLKLSRLIRGETLYVLTEEQLNSMPLNKLKFRLRVKVPNSESLVIAKFKNAVKGVPNVLNYDEESGLFELNYRSDKLESVNRILDAHIEFRKTPIVVRPKFSDTSSGNEEVKYLKFDSVGFNYLVGQLAKRAGLKYESNPLLSGEEFKISGQLIDVYGKDALTVIEDLAFNNAVEFFIKGDACYVLTAGQSEELGKDYFYWMISSMDLKESQEVTSELNRILMSRVGKADFSPESMTISLLGQPGELKKAVDYLLDHDK